MNALERAGLHVAADGGPPLTIDARLLDRVDYARTIGPVELLAERLVVRCEDSDLGAFLAAFLASARPASRARSVLSVVGWRGRWAAYRDGVRTLSMTSVPAMARALAWDLNVTALAAPTDRTHVHAAVVARDGRAMILPGVSGAGKSTLALTLAASGWEYFSDEVAALDADELLVHPYPRPIALDPGSWGLFPASLLQWPEGVPDLVSDLRLVLASSLGAGPPAPAVPTWLVFPKVVRGAQTGLEALSRGEAVRRLVALCFNLETTGRGGLDQLVRVVNSTTCRQLVLDGVTAVPDVLAALTGDSSHSSLDHGV